MGSRKKLPTAVKNAKFKWPSDFNLGGHDGMVKGELVLVGLCRRDVSSLVFTLGNCS